jgi:hypothetical protein
MTVAVAVGWALRGFGRLHSDNVAQIEVGMTQGQVEALLGGPPGDYGTWWGPKFATLDYVVVPNSVRRAVWEDDDNCFEIHFDASDRVCFCYQRRFHGMSWQERMQSNGNP